MRLTVTSASSIRSGPKIVFSLGSIQLSGVRHRHPYNTSNVSSSDSLGNYSCMRTRPTTDSCLNSLGVPSHKPSAYSQNFGLLTQFGRPSVDDRPNCGSNKFWGMHAVAPKSEWQTTTLDQRWLSSELRTSIARELCRSQHILNLVVGVDGYEVSKFGELVHDHPNRIKLTGSQW
jgi:hypothetical protein